MKQHISDLNQRIESNQETSTRALSGTNAADSTVERLKAEVIELVDELRQMHSQQDRLLAEQDRFQDIIHDLETSVSLHKKRFEAIKTELRELKRSSASYPSNDFLPNEKLPLSPNGAIVDVHFTSFTSSIDDLLRAGRFNATNDVILVLKTVIDAVGTIDEDVQQYELNPAMIRRLSHEDQEKLDGLKHRINSTLSNLITAAKNHVMSFGLSPISLLDAAASHLCFSLVELVQLVGMRRATAAEIEMNENLGSDRAKYDDEDPNSHSGLELAAEKFRTATNGNSSHDPGVSSRTKDVPPAPLRIHKERERDYSRTKTSGSSAGDSKTDPNEYSVHSNGSLDRKRNPTGFGNSSHRPYEARNSNEQNLGSTDGRAHNMMNKFEDVRSPSGFDGSNASDLRDSASGSSSTHPDRVFDSPPRGTSTRTIRKTPSIPIHGDLDGRLLDPTESARSHPQGLSHSSRTQEGLDKLKVYLETQTESIVGSIQSLLSTIRGGGGNSTTTMTQDMNENLDQIIKIVLAITDRCSTEVAIEPNDLKIKRILNDLTSNCQKLSQMQDLGLDDHSSAVHQNGHRLHTKYSNLHHHRPPSGLSKQVKQSMAAASFGVAKALKELNSHVAGVEDDSIL